jgi:hypothetical protein
MESVMSTVSRDFVAPDGPNKSPTEPDPPSVEELALVGRADRVTGWRLEKGAGPDRLALMLHEVAVTRGYRPRLLRAGTAAASVRTGIFCVLARTEGLGRGTPLNEEDVFWDGIV